MASTLEFFRCCNLSASTSRVIWIRVFRDQCRIARWRVSIVGISANRSYYIFIEIFQSMRVMNYYCVQWYIHCGHSSVTWGKKKLWEREQRFSRKSREIYRDSGGRKHGAYWCSSSRWESLALRGNFAPRFPVQYFTQSPRLPWILCQFFTETFLCDEMRTIFPA